jgi:hypothetical protein
LEAEGYWPWEERFTLSPEEALNFGVIHLFKQSEPQLIQESKATSGEFSPDKKLFATLQDKTVSIIDVETKTTDNFTINPANGSSTLLWSADSRRLSVAGVSIDIANNTVTDLAKLTKKEITLTRWDGNSLYFIDDNILNYYDTTTQKNGAVDNVADQTRHENLIDYVVKNQTLYAITKDKSNKTTLWVGDLGQRLNSLALPLANYRFLNKDLSKIVLASERHAYLVDEPLPLLSKLRLLEIPNAVAIGQWRGDALVYATPFELRQWNGEHDDQLL